jgi:ferredoxin-NADP reductase
MAAMTYTATLVEKIQRTADTASYRFSRSPEYRFKAGQSFGITIPGPDGPLQHHFSHADSPTEPYVELTTRLTGSPFKKALDSLTPGGAAIIRGPYGRFLFRRQEPRLAFLVGGIGITPVRSMLRYLLDTEGAGRAEGQELVLFYGCMTEDDVLYQEEMEEFGAMIPGLRVLYVITEPKPEWKGHRGFITAKLLRAELQNAASWTYYVVGPPPMILAMEKITRLLAIPEKRIVEESFAGYDS